MLMPDPTPKDPLETVEELERLRAILPISVQEINLFGREWFRFESLVSSLIMETPTGERRESLTDLALILAKFAYALPILRLMQTNPKVVPLLLETLRSRDVEIARLRAAMDEAQSLLRGGDCGMDDADRFVYRSFQDPQAVLVSALGVKEEDGAN